MPQSYLRLYRNASRTARAERAGSGERVHVVSAGSVVVGDGSGHRSQESRVERSGPTNYDYSGTTVTTFVVVVVGVAATPTAPSSVRGRVESVSRVAAISATTVTAEGLGTTARSASTAARIEGAQGIPIESGSAGSA